MAIEIQGGGTTEENWWNQLYPTTSSTPCAQYFRAPAHQCVPCEQARVTVLTPPAP